MIARYNILRYATIAISARFRNQAEGPRTIQYYDDDDDDDDDDDKGEVNLRSNSLCSFLHIRVSSVS
jgi:hypothetical protein